MSSDLLLKIIFRADGAGDVAQAVHEITERLGKTEKEAKQADRALQGTEEALQDTGAAAQKTEQQLDGMAKAADQAAEGLGKTEAFSKSAAGHFGGLQSGVDIVSSSLKGFVVSMGSALAAALSFNALKDATEELIQYNKELQLAEKQLGVSADALQVWGLGAEKAGLSAEKMRDIFKDVSDKLGDFAITGGGEAEDIIKRLNLNINELINLAPDQALLKIIHALDTVKNISQHDRTFLLESLADDASALYPLLKNNAAALRELEEAMNRRGLLITDEEQAILDQASSTLSDMRMAGAGVKQEFGLMGSELLNAFGPSTIAGLDWLIGAVRDFRADAGLLGEVWSESADAASVAFGGMEADASWAFGLIGVYHEDVYEAARLLFTYLPVAGGAAYQVLAISGEAWGYELQATFNAAQGVAGLAFAGIVDFGARAWGLLADGAGMAIGFIIGRFAALVDSLSVIGSIKGMEDFGASISGVAKRIQGTADAARGMGDSVRASIGGMADSIRASAQANLAEAASFKAKASAAEMARKAVIDNAATYIKTKESQREINKAIREQNAELENAASVLDRAGAAKKKYTSHAEAEKAAEEAAAKAKEANKKATDEAAKAAEAATRAYEQEKAALELQIVKLTQGEEAAYRLGLTQKSVTGARQDELVALKNQITQLEEEKKQTEEAAKAQEKIHDALKKAAEALSIVRVEQAQGKEAARTHALELEGYTTAQATAQTADESRTEAIKEQIQQQEKAKEGLKEAAEALSLARIEQEQGKEAARAHALELEGYTATQAAAQVADESRTEAIKAQIQQQEKIRDALKDAANALSIARIEQEQGKEAARAHALELEGYTAAQATAQTADEKRTEALKEQTQQQTKAKDEVKKLREELKVKTVALTQSAAAADLLKYKTEGYGAALAQTRVELEQQIAALDRQGAIANAVSDGLTDAMLEAVKTGRFEFESLADSLEETFNNMVLKPVIQAVMQPVSGLLTNAITGAGNGLAGALGLGNLFGSTGAAGSGLFGSISTSITGAVTSFLGGGGLASSIGSVVGALGPVGLAVGAAMLFGKLFGGKQSIKAAFGNSADDKWEGGGWYGTSRSGGQALQRTTAFGTFGLVDGSRSVGRDSKDQITQMQTLLDGMAALDNAFAALIPNTKEGQAAIDAVRAAMDGFTGNALDGVGLMTERAITMFQAMPEGVKQALQGIDGGLFKDGMKGVAERIQYVGTVAQQVLPQLSALGLKISQSWDLALRDAALLTDALGGTDAALKQLAFYVENFADPAELTAAALKQSQAALDAWNAKLGLSGVAAIDSKAEFEQYIKSLDLTTAAGRDAAASAFQHMQAILAVDKAQKEATENLAAMVKISDQLGIQFDALHPGALGAAEALAQLVGGMDALKDAAAKYYEAAYSDAERNAKEREAAQAKLDAFNRAMKTNIANILDLRAYVETLDPMTKKGRAAIAQAMGMVDALVILGGTAEEIAAKTKQLKDSIADLIGKLYSSSTSTTDTSVDDSASALDAARSALDGLKDSYDAEKERIDAINQANEERYREELARYEGLKDAAQGLRALIGGLTDPIDDKLTALAKAQRAYNGLLQAAQAGDAEAAGKLGGSAQELRDALMNAYGGDQRSVDAIHLLEQQITDAANALDSQAGSAPTQSGAEQGNLTELERLMASQQQLIDSLSKSATGDKATAASDRQALALELAKKIGELGLAQDRSVFELLKENGISLQALATDFGINIGKLDTSMLGSLDKLADALNVDIVSLTRQLGGNIDVLGDLIAKKLEALPGVPDNIKKGLEPYLRAIEKANDPTTLKLAIAALEGHIDRLPPDIKAKLNAELQRIIGNTSATTANINNLIAKNKEAIDALAKSFGIDISKLNQAQLGKLDQLADALHIDTVSLTTALGGNIDRLGNLISTKLGSMDGLPADIEKGLAPYLKAIEKANDPTTLKLAIAALEGHIDQLPPDIKAKLNAELQSIIGNTSATTANIGNLIAKNKEAIEALAKSFGIDVSNLNQSQLTKLDKLADALHIDTVSLAAALGGNIDKMGDLIAGKLGSLPGIPENIKAGLAPYLKAIELANDPTTLKTELQRLQTYVNSLPPDIKAKLNEQLGGILGNTGEQLTQAKADAIELQAIRGVKAQVWEQTVYLRDGIGGGWLADLRKNLRSLNENAADVGKKSIPSYRVGTDALDRDGLIYAHAGEAVYTPEQTDSMRKNSIAALQALPIIAAAALKPTIQQEVIVVNTDASVRAVRQFKADSIAPYVDFKPVLSELQRTRDANERQAYEVIRTAKATLRLLEDWDQYIAVEAAA